MRSISIILKVCPFTVSCIYTILQQIYVQFCLNLQIKVLLIKSAVVIVRISDFRASLSWVLSSLVILCLTQLSAQLRTT